MARQRPIAGRPRNRTGRQADLPFLARQRRLDRAFRRIILIATGLALAGLWLGLAPSLAEFRGWSREVRWGVLRRIGLEPPRHEVEAYWRDRREAREARTRARYRELFARLTPERRAFLDLAGMGPGEVLARWGNYDMTLVFSSKVFDRDDARQYRLRPDVRSVWVRQIGMFEMDTCQFLVPATPEVLRAAEAAGAVPVPGSYQTTNSWGCRGPEPDPSAALRVLVLGDSYMQGYLVGDDDTPPERLGRSLAELAGERVSVLNTGVLGYEPEHEYFALKAYADRFKPHVVVLAPFVNDFGLEADVSRGQGDWDEPAYWYEKIRRECSSRGIRCVVAPAPWEGQLAGLRDTGGYPGRIPVATQASGPAYCDATEAFVDAELKIRDEARREGRPAPARSPLYNGALGDGHFSALGSALWGRTVAARLALILGRDRTLQAASAGVGSP